jgi:hypothetical protein
MQIKFQQTHSCRRKIHPPVHAPPTAQTMELLSIATIWSAQTKVLFPLIPPPKQNLPSFPYLDFIGEPVLFPAGPSVSIDIDFKAQFETTARIVLEMSSKLHEKVCSWPQSSRTANHAKSNKAPTSCSTISGNASIRNALFRKLQTLQLHRYQASWPIHTPPKGLSSTPKKRVPAHLVQRHAVHRLPRLKVPDDDVSVEAHVRHLPARQVPPAL